MTIRKFILAIFTVFAAQLLAAQIVFAAGSSSSSTTEAEAPITISAMPSGI